MITYEIKLNPLDENMRVLERTSEGRANILYNGIKDNFDFGRFEKRIRAIKLDKFCLASFMWGFAIRMLLG